jgi:hypothetical protein
MLQIRIRNILLLLVIAYPSIILAQPKPFSAEEIDRMTNTYTYYLAQKASLESVSARFPNLKDYANNAFIEWIKEFKSSIIKIDSDLQIIKGKNWEGEKEKIFEKYREADHSNVTEKEARQYIDIVFQRSFGKIQSPILETLLTFKPEYIESPEKEFSDGYVNNFYSTNPKKKIGLNLRVLYPKSWISIPGNSKNGINQIFISNYGSGRLAMTFLLERSASIPMDKTGPLLTESYLRKNCPKNDSIMKYISGLTIDNCPAAGLSYIRRETDIDKNFCILCETYQTYYKNNHITLIFSYNSEYNNVHAILKEYEKYRKLIHKMISNVVILSQWEQKRF